MATVLNEISNVVKSVKLNHTDYTNNSCQVEFPIIILLVEIRIYNIVAFIANNISELV